MQDELLTELLQKYSDLEKYFNYQQPHTSCLDNLSGDFDQNVINEIVLWKVNRYALMSEQALEALNKISTDSLVIDMEQTKAALTLLLEIKGVQLAMASTILRFKNPNIYQIIDQRVYRILYGGRTLNTDLKSYSPTQLKIDIYFKYIADLRIYCEKYNVVFSDADRVLYLADIEYNKGNNIIY